MRMQFNIRRPRSDEHDRIRALVSQVVNETYGSIWPTTPIDVGVEDWGAGWVAVAVDELLGWTLTQEGWVEDLWVAAQYRQHGVGSALLARAEMEIAARGVTAAHLHVIASNERAIAFYQRRTWQRLREVSHEVLTTPRLEMIKIVG
jgi:ribosomal protein S18 acetylase RimI-like enzyme